MPPIDPSLLPLNTAKLRPGAPATQRTRTPDATQADENPGLRPQGRRAAPAVSVSLSAEALSILNGDQPAPRRAAAEPPPIREDRPRTAPQPESTNATGAADAVFEALDLRETSVRIPGAAVERAAQTERLRPPGSRLDITV